MDPKAIACRDMLADFDFGDLLADLEDEVSEAERTLCPSLPLHPALREAPLADRVSALEDWYGTTSARSEQGELLDAMRTLLQDLEHRFGPGANGPDGPLSHAEARADYAHLDRLRRAVGLLDGYLTPWVVVYLKAPPTRLRQALARPLRRYVDVLRHVLTGEGDESELSELLDAATEALVAAVIEARRCGRSNAAALDAARRLALALDTVADHDETEHDDTPPPLALAPPGRTVTATPVVAHAPPAWWASAAA